VAGVYRIYIYDVMRSCAPSESPVYQSFCSSADIIVLYECLTFLCIWWLHLMALNLAELSHWCELSVPLVQNFATSSVN